MTLKLQPLPYEYSALAPHIGAETVETHYEKHHRGYLEKVNEAIAGTALERKSLRELVLETDGDLYNNAAQVWNHDFYWRSMSPTGGGSPSSSLTERIRAQFGGVDALKKELAGAATQHFGSGWAWLVKTRDGALKVLATHDAENPLTIGVTALVTVDVWEHAYYLDHKNERPKYIDAFLQHLIDWQFVEQNLAAVSR
jgi:Fe-Mn family superoxide dismutase